MSFKNCKILVIDDSEISTSLLSLQLTKMGHTPEILNDSLQAEERIKASNPDIILMDMEMPGMTGIELGRHLKTSNKNFDTPIIYTSAEYKAESIADCFEYGNDFVLKPIRPDELNARIKALLTVKDLLKQRIHACSFCTPL